MGDPLGPYKADPLINRQWQDDADHDVLSMNAAYQAWSIGVNVAREKTLKNTALRYVLERSAEESAIAIQELLLVDMTNARGVEVARALQARAIRYRELIEWLEEAVQIGNEGYAFGLSTKHSDRKSKTTA